MAKNPHFVVKPFLGLGTAEGLVDSAIVTDADEGPESVFDLIHEMRNMPRFPEKNASFSSQVACFILPGRLA
jgi:hypothetical protein